MKDNRNLRLLHAIGDADDKYVKEADPRRIRRARRIPWISAIAACLVAVVTALNLWLFLPLEADAAIAKYKDSEYFELIEALYSYKSNKTIYKNNFDKLLNAGKQFLKNEAMEFLPDVDFEVDAPVEEVMPSPGEPDGGIGAPDSSAPNGNINSGNNENGSYVESTDNQVAGVIEADLLKRTEKYAFYITRKNDKGSFKPELVVYSIAGENSKEVARIGIGRVDFVYGMYLSADGNTATLIVTDGATVSNLNTTLISYDISDIESISEKGRFSISGHYLSSRYTGNALLLTTTFYVNSYRDFDYGAPETFVPSVTYNGKTERLGMDSIVCPDVMTSSNYTVVTLLDGDTLEVKSNYGMLSYYGDIYVTEDSVYLFRRYSAWENTEDPAVTVQKSISDITRIGYTDTELTLKGVATVDGSIKDQYSLDEYNGVLRVASTISTSRYETVVIGENSYNRFIGNEVNASLWCIDVDRMKVVASVESFAPAGETVRSARFDGDTAYICTAVEFTDPVFCFDLSDLDNITYKDTGNIEGYSSSLVQLGDGYLLGIGYEDRNTLKIEVWRETEDGVESVDAYTSAQTYFSEEYKSYLIDREKGLVGLSVERYNGEGMGHEFVYLLLQFNGEELVTVAEQAIDACWCDKTRAFVQDEYAYVFIDNGKLYVLDCTD